MTELDPSPSRDSLERLADEHVTDVVSLYRRDGSCLYAGVAVQRVLGYTPEEWLALRPRDLVHPADQRTLLARFADEGDDAPWRLTVRVRRRSGEYLWMETTGQVVRDESGGELVRTTARDVTERKRAEDAVHYLGRQVKLVLDAAAVPILGVDAEGTVTFANPAAAHALGYPVPELVGRSHESLLPPDAPRPDAIAATLADGAARRGSGSELLRGDGTRLTVEYTCNPSRRKGQVVGAVVTFRDVAERQRAEASIRRAEWLAGVGQTALALRHEINNPLTTLLAEASMLEVGGNSPAEEREMIASIAYQARRIRDVVRRLTERQDDPPVRLDGAQTMLDLSE